MKAAVFYNCGDASQIQIAEVPEPQIGAWQVCARCTPATGAYLPSHSATLRG